MNIHRKYRVLLNEYSEERYKCYKVNIVNERQIKGTEKGGKGDKGNIHRNDIHRFHIFTGCICN